MLTVLNAPSVQLLQFYCFRFTNISSKNRHERGRCSLAPGRSRTSSRSSSRASTLSSITSSEEDLFELSDYPSIVISEDPEFEKLITEDVTNYYTQFKLAVKLGVKVKHIYPILFNVKGRLACDKQLSEIGCSGRDFDSVLRLKSILEDAKLRGVDFIELPKKLSISNSSDEIVHLDSFMKPIDLDRHGKRLLEVKETDKCFLVSLYHDPCDVLMTELTNRFSDLSSEDLSQRSNSQGYGLGNRSEDMEVVTTCSQDEGVRVDVDWLRDDLGGGVRSDNCEGAGRGVVAGGGAARGVGVGGGGGSVRNGEVGDGAGGGGGGDGAVVGRGNGVGGGGGDGAGGGGGDGAGGGGGGGDGLGAGLFIGPIQPVLGPALDTLKTGGNDRHYRMLMRTRNYLNGLQHRLTHRETRNLLLNGQPTLPTQRPYQNIPYLPRYLQKFILPLLLNPLNYEHLFGFDPQTFYRIREDYTEIAIANFRKKMHIGTGDAMTSLLLIKLNHDVPFDVLKVMFGINFGINSSY